MQLPIHEDKWKNYINLGSKLKDRFKQLKNKGKTSEKEFDSICLIGNPKVHKTGINNTPTF